MTKLAPPCLALLALAACGARTPIGDYLDPVASSGRGGDGSGASGGSSAAGGAAGATSFQDVCLGFTELVNGASDEAQCQTCITQAELGPCAAALEATFPVGACEKASDCASLCECDPGGCPPTVCACDEACLTKGPISCMQAWASLFSCLSSACAGGC